jgi:hypothetical protein
MEGWKTMLAAFRNGTVELKFKNVWQGKDFKSRVFVSVAGKGVIGAFFRMCGK